MGKKYFGKNEFSRFPKMPSTVSVKDLSIYEKALGIDIFLYNLQREYNVSKSRYEHTLGIIHKGSNRYIPENKRVYLVSLMDTNHVVCVKNGMIQPFIRCAKAKHYTGVANTADRLGKAKENF